MRANWPALTVFIALLGHCASAVAEPFPLPNSSPFARLSGPPAAQHARLIEPGRIAASLLVSGASHSASADAGVEQFLLDGETWEASLSIKKRLTAGALRAPEIGVDLPLLVHENGFMDPAIDAYHRATGLPAGERGSMPTNQLLYLYRNSANREVRLDNPAAGIGDMTLYAAWPLGSDATPDATALSLRAALKLPTGDSDRLLGSGGADLSLAVAGLRPFRLASRDAQVYWRAGVLAPAIAGNAVLQDLQKDLVAFATFSAVWHRWQHLSLKIQADSNTALYHSGIREIGGAPLQLVVGGVWWADQHATGERVEFGFAEDLAIDRSPDIVFFVNWMRQY